jgi:hypothetical protein
VRSFPRFAFAAAGLLTLACRGSASPEPTPGTGTAPAEIILETILQRSIPGQGGREICEVARDEASWAASLGTTG